MVADDINTSASQGAVGRRRVRVLPSEILCPETASGTCDIMDAAAFLIKIVGPVSRGKLQDLLYFAQAWHLVWDNELMYKEPIMATEEGVRIDSVELLLGDIFTVEAKHVRKGKVGRLSESQQRTLLGIVKFYASRSHFRLSEQIREETPWQRARAGALSGEPVAVDPAALHRYYREL